jgi:hypothetical protein
VAVLPPYSAGKNQYFLNLLSEWKEDNTCV